MVWRSVLLLFLSGLSIGKGNINALYPIDVGLNDEDPLMPRERDALDDCHMRYMRYGREELQTPTELKPYDEPREYSHVAAIGWTRAGGAIDWNCIGTLIWDSIVLTSAQCTIDDGNAAPDIIRMGGGHYFPGSNRADTRYIQDRKVKEVIRHPQFSAETGANDIALLQLEEKIAINRTAAPTCMWLWSEVPFEKLQSIGRAKDGTVPQSSVITDEMLDVKDKDHCFSFALREEGLHESQICTETIKTGSAKCMDASRGDLLQTSLLHNYKRSPFLVGFLSSRLSPGTCNPTRVYTKVATYRDWLTQTLQERNLTVHPQNFFPHACAHRFGSLRPRVPELIEERNVEIARLGVQVDFQAHRNLGYIARIGWPSEAGNGTRRECAGTFVDQRTLLTLAECVATTPEGFQPTTVFHSSRYGNRSYPIETITVHPDYVAGSLKNNIAVLKLEKPQDFIPACMWLHDGLPDRLVDLAGIGQNDLNNFLDDDPYQQDAVSMTVVLPAVDHYPWKDCRPHLTRLARIGGSPTLQGLDEEEHMCFHNDQWTVPGVCRQLPGGPVQRYIYRAGAYFKYVYALTLFGRTCGYGEPSVAIRIAPHAAWLRSVMLDKSATGLSALGSSGSESLIIINPDLKRSDECSNGNGAMGICVPYELCRSTAESLRAGEQVTVCSIGSIVCCPWGDIAKSSGVDPVRTELESCEERYRPMRRQRYNALNQNETDDNLAHLGEIGWPRNNGKIEFVCIGYLIASRAIVTSARCLESLPYNPTVVRLGSLGASDPSNYLLQTIRRVRVHEDYDGVTGVNNIALLTLTDAVEANAFHFPACLYRNMTHVPVRQFIISRARASTSMSSISPIYRSECLERAGDSLASTQSCYLRKQEEAKLVYDRGCFKSGDVLVWERSTEEAATDPHYLVGIFSHGGCELDDVQFATHIPAFFDWIVSNIK